MNETIYSGTAQLSAEGPATCSSKRDGNGFRGLASIRVDGAVLILPQRDLPKSVAFWHWP
jgi:hypothetical protein